MNRTVVIFADDEPMWHKKIDDTKQQQILTLKNVLANCEIISVFDSKELFKTITTLVNDDSVKHILIFLDLNFPSTKDGLEVLNRISRNRNTRIRQIPVFVYSISQDPSDVASAYSRLCSGFYHKLSHPETFWKALTKIDQDNSHHISNPVNFDGKISPPPKNDMPNTYGLN